MFGRKKDEALDTAARGLHKVAARAGDAVANTVLAPLRSDKPCTCKNDRKCKH